MRRVTLGEFITESMLVQAQKIGADDVKRICVEVIEPNMAEINRKLGQENDPMYLAYALSHGISQADKRLEQRLPTLLASLETAILKGTWENVLGAPPTLFEAWTTKHGDWTVNVALNRPEGHQDGAAASATRGTVVHLTPELVKLAVEQIDKVKRDLSQ